MAYGCHVLVQDCSNLHDFFHLGGRYYLSTQQRLLTIRNATHDYTHDLQLSPLTVYHFPCDLTFVNQPTGFGTCPKRMSYMFLCLQTITFIMSLGSVKQTITSYVYTTIPSALLLHSTLPTIPYNHWIKHLTYWTDNLQLR